jgi:hypothetical protein
MRLAITLSDARTDTRAINRTGPRMDEANQQKQYDPAPIRARLGHGSVVVALLGSLIFALPLPSPGLDPAASLD